MTRADKFEEIFGYRPATDQVLCNEHDCCGESDACNYCTCNRNNIGREEDWWNAEYIPLMMNISICICCPFYSPIAIYKTAPEYVSTFGSCRKLREDIYSIDPCNQILSKCPFVEKEESENE